MSDHSSADASAHKCGKYELIKPHEDAGIGYEIGSVLLFTCEEAEFLMAHARITGPVDKPITRKRLLVASCAGCPGVLSDVTEPEAAPQF